MAYVHKQCLTDWLNLKLNRKDKQKKSVVCELCQTPIEFEASKVRKLKSYEEVRHSIKENVIAFVLTIFTFLLVVGLIIGIGVLIEVDLINEKSEHFYFTFVIFGGGVILIIILGIYLMIRFCLKV